MDSNPPATERRSRDTALLVVAAVVALIVVAAVIAVFVKPQPTIDPDSAAGTVAQYLEAIAQHDDDAAREFVAPALLEGCTNYWEQPQRDATVSLRTSDETGSRATVQVDITMGEGAFGRDVFGGGYTEGTRFTLIKDDGAWLITETPWQFEPCSLGGAR